MKATLVQPRCVLKPDHQTYTRDIPVLKSQPNHVELIEPMQELLGYWAKTKNLSDVCVLWNVVSRGARSLTVQFQVHPREAAFPGSPRDWAAEAP